MEDITFNQLIDKVINKYNLDRNILLGNNKDYYYLIISDCILLINCKTYYSKCLYNKLDNKHLYERVEALINAIQTLNFFIKFNY